MIDLIASLPHYAVHLESVVAELPPELRGGRAPRRAGERIHDAVLVGSASDLSQARRLGYPRIAYLEHGIGQSYSNAQTGYPGGAGRDTVGLFLSPNETAAARDRLAYPAARVEVVGDPRLDTLPRLNAAPGTVAISFHWATTVAPETKPALAHYRGVLGELAAAVPLIGHAHPKAADRMRPIYRKLGIEFVETFDEVCERASVYVCDNSSTIFEFASTGRPVVVLNAPWFRRDAEHGLRFWEAAGVGINVDEPGDLVAAVELALTDPPAVRSARNAAIELAYAYRTDAASRAASAIADWLTVVTEVAA